jgi:hypothetical protein
MVLRGESPPAPGDKVVFFYAPAGGSEPGFYGWAVVLQWSADGEDQRLYFRPVPPSDHLKMDPWWDAEASRIVNQIRGGVAMGTLWPVPNDLALAISKGIAAWVTRGNTQQVSGEQSALADRVRDLGMPE